MTTLTATTARKQFFDLVKDATKKRRIFRIQHRDGAAVMMSEADFEEIQETLELLSIPGFRESLSRSVRQMECGQTVGMDDVFGK